MADKQNQAEDNSAKAYLKFTACECIIIQAKVGKALLAKAKHCIKCFYNLQ